MREFLGRIISRLACWQYGHSWYDEERKVVGNGWYLITTGKLCMSCHRRISNG